MSDSKNDDFLSMQDIIDADDVQYAIAEVPEWKKADGTPGKARFGSLSAGDLIEFAETNDGPARRTAGLRLIVKSLVDGAGARIGTDEHLQFLKSKDARVCARLVDVIMELNGLNKKSQEAAKNDSGEVATDASPTVLH